MEMTPKELQETYMSLVLCGVPYNILKGPDVLYLIGHIFTLSTSPGFLP